MTSSGATPQDYRWPWGQERDIGLQLAQKAIQADHMAAVDGRSLLVLAYG